MLSTRLIPILRERFPNRGLVVGESPAPCATFPGIHPGIRDVSIYDDEYELTVSVAELTHSHFSDYDDAAPDDEKERRIVQAVVEFLSNLFADRVAVWGLRDQGGGWYQIGQGDSSCHPGAAEFVWSGPLTNTHI